MSLFAKMIPVFDKAKLPRISPFYAILPSIFCARKHRRGLVSRPSVSKLVGTTTIFSAFWMGLIRCDCPDLAVELVAIKQQGLVELIWLWGVGQSVRPRWVPKHFPRHVPCQLYPRHP